MLTALQPSPVETCSQFGLREMFLPFWVQFPAEAKQGCSLPFIGCRWRRGAMENQKYKYPRPSGCFGGILISVWKGPSAARAVIAVTDRTKRAQAALGHALGKDELFWALRLQGCAEPLQWGTRSRLGVGAMPLPSRAPRPVSAAHSARQTSGIRQGVLSPRPHFPGSPGHKGSHNAAGLSHGDCVVSLGQTQQALSWRGQEEGVSAACGRKAM